MGIVERSKNMREERIIIRPFDKLKLIEYHGVMQVNEHAQAEIKGQIPFEIMKEYMQLGKQQTWVQVVAVSQSNEYILWNLE